MTRKKDIREKGRNDSYKKEIQDRDTRMRYKADVAEQVCPAMLTAGRSDLTALQRALHEL